VETLESYVAKAYPKHPLVPVQADDDIPEELRDLC
jgi:hypothetical protein